MRLIITLDDILGLVFLGIAVLFGILYAAAVLTDKIKQKFKRNKK